MAGMDFPNSGTFSEDILEREQKCFAAKISEEVERFDEMSNYMRELVELLPSTGDMELTVEERNLLSVSFKNAVGARRASWRIISSLEERENMHEQYENAARCETYRTKIENEVHSICSTLIALLDSVLIPGATTPELKVFYYKMSADYYRYIAEISNKTAGTEAAVAATEAYETARKWATEELDPTHPMRLGLALNYSVFHYEILNQKQKACKMAQDAYVEAMQLLEALEQKPYKENATLVMGLIRDNLTLWTSAAAEVSED